MSERLSFGCACCSPHMLPVYQHDHDTWQDVLETVAERYGRDRRLVEPVIFHGGQIYPDPERPELCVEAIGIADGKVIATGTLAHVREAMRPYAQTEQIERALKGDQTLLPGLIDPHAHLITSALMTTWADLSPFDGQNLNAKYTRGEIRKRLQHAVEKADADPAQQGWVKGFGVDPSLMVHWKDIDVHFLDDISTKVKIFLLNASGHISYANTPALKAAGLDPESTKGVLTEQQSQAVLQKMPQVKPVDILEGLMKVFQQANACGITTVFDASIGLIAGSAEIPMMKALAATPAMTVRVGGALYGNSNDLMTWVNCFKPELSSVADSLFTLRAIKLIADGSNQGLTGFQSVPYDCCDRHFVPGVGAYGLFNFDPVRKLADVMAVATAAGWPILTHANGDEAIANVLAAYQLALSTVPPPPPPKRPFPTPPAWAEQRHRIEHASLLHDEAIGLMRRMAISPSFLIGHVGYWGKAFKETILGSERAMLLDRTASALRAGLRISLHSDHFVTPFGPLRCMEQAIGRVMEAVELTGPNASESAVLNREERLDANQALRAVTIDAAWQCHLDHQIGSLLPGKQADLVILEENPLRWSAVNATGMRDIAVCETWVNGSKVFPLPR
ncbi:amidohydrolase [Xanthomonas sp. LMG 12459]|uniref:amidohydrolase n=1 Tax=Xanthomonas sp. LMG 12459 TaxID=1591131 RepID=UPI00186AFAE4|nr:amidohydrolase [Xanthomonas sp. LMG 12459]